MFFNNQIKHNMSHKFQRDIDGLRGVTGLEGDEDTSLKYTTNLLKRVLLNHY